VVGRRGPREAWVDEQALQGLLLVGGERGFDAGEREMGGEGAFLDCEATLL